MALGDLSLFDSVVAEVSGATHRLVPPAIAGLTDVQRQTLLAFIDCDMDVGRTALALFVHRNTVHYRLRQISGRRAAKCAGSRICSSWSSASACSSSGADLVTVHDAIRARCRQLGVAASHSPAACVSRTARVTTRRGFTMRFAPRVLVAGAVCLAVGLTAPTIAAAADTHRRPRHRTGDRLDADDRHVRVLRLRRQRRTAVVRDPDRRGVEPAPTSPSRTDFGGLLSNTAYTARVVAVDRAGNESAPSQPVSFTTPSWSRPRGLTVTSVSGSTVSLAWERQSDMDPYRFLVYDGGRGEAVTRIERTTMQRLAPGVHTFTVRAMRANRISPRAAP